MERLLIYLLGGPISLKHSGLVEYLFFWQIHRGMSCLDSESPGMNSTGWTQTLSPWEECLEGEENEGFYEVFILYLYIYHDMKF